MSPLLMRLGLWTILAVLVVHVLHETFPESQNLAFATPAFLSQAGLIGAAMAGAGIVMSLIGKAASKGIKANRCVICRTAVRPGSIYCREHLRNVLSDEHDRRHLPRTTR